MKAAIAFYISLHRVNPLIPFFIEGTTGCLEITTSLCKLVIIDEVITRIIGRVYVDHLDCAKIVLTENFEHVKIITFDI